MISQNGQCCICSGNDDASCSWTKGSCPDGFEGWTEFDRHSTCLEGSALHTCAQNQCEKTFGNESVLCTADQLPDVSAPEYQSHTCYDLASPLRIYANPNDTTIGADSIDKLGFFIESPGYTGCCSNENSQNPTNVCKKAQTKEFEVPTQTCYTYAKDSRNDLTPHDRCETFKGHKSLTLFKDKDYKGTQWKLDEGVDRIPHIGNPERGGRSGWNDNLSSFKIEGDGLHGISVYFFKDDDYGSDEYGPHRRSASYVKDASPWTDNDEVTSIIINKDPPTMCQTCKVGKDGISYPLSDNTCHTLPPIDTSSYVDSVTQYKQYFRAGSDGKAPHVPSDDPSSIQNHLVPEHQCKVVLDSSNNNIKATKTACCCKHAPKIIGGSWTTAEKMNQMTTRTITSSSTNTDATVTQKDSGIISAIKRSKLARIQNAFSHTTEQSESKEVTAKGDVFSGTYTSSTVDTKTSSEETEKTTGFENAITDSLNQSIKQALNTTDTQSITTTLQWPPSTKFDTGCGGALGMTNMQFNYHVNDGCGNKHSYEIVPQSPYETYWLLTDREPADMCCVYTSKTNEEGKHLQCVPDDVAHSSNGACTDPRKMWCEQKYVRPFKGQSQCSWIDTDANNLQLYNKDITRSSCCQMQKDLGWTSDDWIDWSVSECSVASTPDSTTQAPSATEECADKCMQHSCSGGKCLAENGVCYNNMTANQCKTHDTWCWC